VFMYTSVVGSIVLYCGVFSLMPNVTSTVSCNFQIWLIGTGIILLFGPLFAKSWRVILILRGTSQLRQINISNAKVLFIVLLLLLIEFTLLIIGSAATDLKANLQIIDPYRVSENYYLCNGNSGLEVILIILVIFKFLLLVTGSIIGYKLRNIPLKVFNESKSIGFAMYNVFFFFTLGVIFQEEIKSSQRDAKFVILSCFLLLSGSITVGTVVGQKILLVRNKQFGVGPDMRTKSEKGRDTSELATSSEQEWASNKKSTSSHDDKYALLEEEYNELKKKYTQLEQAYANIKSTTTDDFISDEEPTISLKESEVDSKSEEVV